MIDHVTFGSPQKLLLRANGMLPCLQTREGVDAFYQAALAAGGRDNGEPGVRAHYHPNYYGAFVFDPDGRNIEVACHGAAE
ncbi:MAG: putative lactoylglutathione lyase [Patiriisocius sp.]|jgi:predicted lactoylglutathione lyase